MNIHEYQAKEILRSFNVPTPKGYVAFNAEEAIENAKKLDTKIWVVKAQIHAGGRGLGGGVKIAKKLDEIKAFADQMIGMKLITKQTSKDGQEVHKVYIEEGVDIKKEYYLSIVLDRAKEMPVIIASSEGGMSIEDIAESSPEKIIKVYIDPLIGFKNFHGIEVAYSLGLEDSEAKNLIKFI
ncbi:MAG: succinate--CoA ligase subunit beta, partial [Campylobacteraceae bacterium]|nr:succinate--CoA ligase subunit beta [Campylobacteraceae bacterium]